MSEFGFHSLDADLAEACFDVFGERSADGAEAKAEIEWSPSALPLSVAFTVVERLAAGQGSGDRYYESLGERVAIRVRTADLEGHEPLPTGCKVRLPDADGLIDPVSQYTLANEDSNYGPVVSLLRLDRARMSRQHSKIRADR